MSKSITVVGAGLVGRGWAIVFARGGHRVRIFDVTAEKIADALGVIEKNLADLASHRLVSNPDEIRAPWTSRDTTEDELGDKRVPLR
jgi:L-gulonate 3-dehydrogenase